MRKLVVVGLMVLPLLVAGCNKGPSEAALKVADEAIAKVVPEAQKFVPDQAKGLTDAAAAARAKFDAGDYTGALAAANALPAKATEVMTAATAKKDAWMGVWKGFQESLPGVVGGITEKVTALEAMKKLPKGIDAAGLAAAKTALTDVTGMWTEATEAFTAGDFKTALENGGEVKARAEGLTKMLEGVQIPPKPVKK
jgi:hypothetical protein